MSREEILEIICDIYEQYGIDEFGFKISRILREMEIQLVKYSQYDGNEDILCNLDRDGFNYYDYRTGYFVIVYNDDRNPILRVKFTIPHELGHIVLGHSFSKNNGYETLEQNEEANIFANEFYCPQAFIIHYNLFNVTTLMSSFDITKGYAETLLAKVKERETMALSPNELRLIEIFERNKKIK